MLCKHEDLSSDPCKSRWPQHKWATSCNLSAGKTSVLGSRKRRIPGGYWPTILAKMACSPSGETLSPNIRWKMVEENTCNHPPASHTLCPHIYAQVYMFSRPAGYRSVVERMTTTTQKQKDVRIKSGVWTWLRDTTKVACSFPFTAESRQEGDD